MTAKQQQRCWFIGLILTVVLGIVIIVLTSLKDHLLFFATPADVLDGKIPMGKSMRLGGLVKKGSISHSDNGLTLHFTLIDARHAVTVTFTGLPPDLFKDGQGVIAEGVLTTTSHFTASKLLAKHDENYTPKEVMQTLPKTCT